MQGDIFQIDKEPLLKIPIINADILEQEKIAQIVDSLISNKKEFKQTLETALGAIKLNYGITNLPNKLNEFYKMGLNPFKDELESLGAEIGIEKIEALMSWYKNKSAMLINLEKEISEIQFQIDNQIYSLYGISDNEIKIIEGE